MNEKMGNWVTVASFFPPPAPEPAFEDLVAAEAARWSDIARQAGLPPEAHLRVVRGETEVDITVSPALSDVFTPEQTEWWAV